jgi:hypothetical protein
VTDVLVLLGRPDCRLCDEMQAVTERVRGSFGLALEKRDVRDDPETRRRYLLEIPVLLLDGEELARHRVSETELRRRLSERLRPPA